MSKEIYISSTPHETRLAIVEDEALTEIYYERENEYTLAGSIYNGRVTRVLPGMQSSFVDIGLERDAFLYITDFMEEAPDSAEFDTTSHGDQGGRAPKLNAAPRTEEGVPRSDGGGRDRGGRGRRGGRDRNGGERGGGERTQGERPVEGEEYRPVVESAGELEDSTIDIGSTDTPVGEGAPGADGSRRWRGRRGRRRGRGGPGGGRDEAAPESVAAPFDVESEAGYEIDGAAAEEATFEGVSAAPPVVRDSERQDSGRQVGGRGEVRERSRESEGRGREGQRRDQRPQRVPRGFAPKTDFYGVDSSAAAEVSSATGPVAGAYGDGVAVGEPIILPGESLSKYRKGSDDAQSAKAPEATPVTLAPPANLLTVVTGWDGGAVLPGETLRRRPAETQNQSRFEPRRESGRDGGRSSGRDSRHDRDGRGFGRRDERVPFHEESPVEPVAVPVPAYEAMPPAAEEDKVPVQTQAATPVDYEPTEASVSYRVDPLPRSEFRQSAPVLEPPVELAETPEGEPIATTSAAVPEAASSLLATELPEVPQRDAAPESFQTEAEPQAEPQAAVSQRVDAITIHEVTSISDAGEMVSEPIEPLAAADPAPIEVPEPASPIRHEGAVLAPAESLRSNSFVEEPSATRVFEGGFAPGAGELAEELLDDDEYDGMLHASSIEELDDLDEEETLEGAADLGTMLREMSIDQITRTSPELEEEDDFEEDDLEEDDLDEEDDDEEGSEESVIEGGADLSDFNEESQEEAARAGSPEDAEYFAKQFGQGGGSTESSIPAGRTASGQESERRGRREGGRRDGRRGRNDRDRNDRGDRPRNTGGSGDRDRAGRSGGHSNSGGRGRTMQATNLPAISDLLKPGQEILVQIAKEPIAKKGARITSHIALPGRFLVFMPTVSHTGVSRKIESDAERRRLKEILLSEKGEASGGFIVRTAAEGASEDELRSDLRFLLNLWSDIKARSESSKSPALIYHDLNLVERILRDQVTDNFSAIWVDTESEYERVLRFLQRFQPSLIRRVKLYSKETPLFEQFGITEEINKALRSKVWLKSGGSIVINQTEALVAIDINTGKFVGKTARLEDTIVKTNLDAIPEIVRQIRLRDLGGIIIIDFIDMDERKNRNRVMAALEEELKSDRAPSKVLQFNDFGLVAITRKRVKQSLERTLSTTCNVCAGTGMVKSPITVCNDIFVEMRKMHKHLERGDVMLRVHPEVVKQLKTAGSKWLQEMEEMCGKTILVKSDPSLHPEQFDIH
jgi:ribonuclease G